MATTLSSDYHPFRSTEARDRYHAYYDSLEMKSSPSEERMVVNTTHAATLVRITGSAGAPPLVIHPGTWAHSLDYPQAFVEPLSASYRVYRIDDPWDLGRCVSTRPLGSVQDTMHWLDELLDALGLTRTVFLFGISKGAWRIAEYALHAPERLAGVIWMSPALVVSRASMRGLFDVIYMLPVMARPTVRSVARGMRPLCATFEREDPDGFRAYIEGISIGLQCFAKVPIDARARVLRDDELSGLKVPVLYMTGEHDTLAAVEPAVSRLRKLGPRAEVTVFPGTGHDLISLEPGTVASRMLEFLGTRSV